MSAGFTIKMACQNNACKSHKKNSHKQRHVLISVDLVQRSETFRCCNVQCLACGHHAIAPMAFEVTTGVIHQGHR